MIVGTVMERIEGEERIEMLGAPKQNGRPRNITPPVKEVALSFKKTKTIDHERLSLRCIGYDSKSDKERLDSLGVAIRTGDSFQGAIQGDHSTCSKPTVDFKTKVPFWPG